MRNDHIDRNTCLNKTDHVYKDGFKTVKEGERDFELLWCCKCGSISHRDGFTVPDEAKDDWHKDSLQFEIARLHSNLSHERKKRLEDVEEKTVYASEVIKLNNSLKKKSRARKYYVRYVRHLTAFINDKDYVKKLSIMIKKELRDERSK